MKVRSDFVTNSSSYSSVCIKIQNRALAELLQNYKADRLHAYLSVEDDLVLISEEEQADQWRSAPETLEELMEAVISNLSREDSGGEMRRELEERKQELQDRVERASWDFHDDSYGEFWVPPSERSHFLTCTRNADRTVTASTQRSYHQGVTTKEKRVYFEPVDRVEIKGRAFVLTGDFAHCGNDRAAIKELIVASGGRCTGSISGKTNYLVIGSLENFGAKKVEQARELQRKGQDIRIIREEDLFRSLEDAPSEN